MRPPYPDLPMYLALKHSHLATAVVAILLTWAWTLVAWRRAAAGQRDFSGGTRGWYIGNRVGGGLAALSGLGVSFAGPWATMWFPYLGLAAFIVHGFAAAASKRALISGDGFRLGLALVLQNLAWLFAAYVMVAKAG